jgi:MoaA/NifB/PqqE/SkfB family radical SAM enzyme
LNKYCALVDLGLATQTDGTVTVCNQSRTLFTDPLGKTIRLDSHSIEDGWNSPTRQEIKQALLNGQQHANCRDCWDEEAAGRSSIRTRANQDYAEVRPMDQPRVFMLKPGNACNLTCRHCNPYVSSKWYKDHYTATQHTSNITFKEYASRYDSIRDSFDDENHLWDTLKKWNDGIVFYDLYGAEPLLINPLLEVLRHSVSTGSSKHQDIHINTNGTIWHDDFNTLFANFNHVELAVSIDGIADQFEYMRYPANWSKVLENLKRYQQLAQFNTSIKFSVCITVSLLNVYYLIDYLNFFHSMGIETTVNIVHRPNYLNVRIAPQAVKQAIIDNLNIKRLTESSWDFKVKEIIDYIRLDYEDPQELLKEFWRHTNLYDKLREQSYAEIFSEFYKVLTNE